MRCAAVVVAGGSGARFGGLKQFALLGGESVAARSVTACRTVAELVVLVVPEGMTAQDHGADLVVVGGQSRSASVRAGLAALPDEIEAVVVHDAARPLAGERLFYAVLAELSDEAVDGAIVGTPVTDTIKRTLEREGRRHVAATLERAELVAVQTPQAFRAEALRKAHVGEPEATDDAALLEAVGATVVVVPGEEGNLKITSPADLALAERAIGGA